MKKWIIIFAMMILVAFYVNCNVIYSHQNNNQEIILGIIDGNLTANHDNVINPLSPITRNEKQHGDLVLNFLEKYDKNVKIAYYNAEKDDRITTESLIEGLNWMLDNKVSYVCISLSSAYYSKELEMWFNQHREDIIVYASYNNLYNTIDYPAQYADVVGVGSGSRILYKENDIKYRSKRILLINRGFYWFCGNSFLAPMQMVVDKRREVENEKN